MNLDTEIYSHTILAALFNGLYQGLLLTIGVWLGLKLFRQLNATTRHAAYFATLLLVTALPVVHVLLGINGRSNKLAAAPESSSIAERSIAKELFSSNDARHQELEPVPLQLPPDNLTAEAPADDQPDPIPGHLQLFVETRPTTDPMDIHWQPRVRRPSNMAAETPATDDPVNLPTPIATTTPAAGSLTPLANPSAGDGTTPEKLETAVPASAGVTSKLPSSWRRPYPAELPSRVSLIVLEIVGTIAGVRVIWLLGQCVLLLRLKQQAQPVASAIDGLCARIGSELCVRRPVQARESDGIRTPIAIGFVRPVVLLPKGFTNDTAPAEVESILRHELAHVRRGDDWTNLFQQFVGAAMFFHPAVWWLSRRLTVEREIACDDYAVARAGSARAYALFLAEFAGRACGRDWAAAPAAWRSKSQLKERIHMLLDPKRNASTRLARARTGLLTTAAITAAAVAVIAGPRLVLADPSPRAIASPSADSAVTVETTTDITAPVAADVVVFHSKKPHPTAIAIAPVATIDARVKVDPAPSAISITSSGVATVVAPIPVADARPVIAYSTQPTLRLAQVAPPAPVPPAPPRPGRRPALADPSLTPPNAPGDGSLEQRLQRLEDLVQSMVKQRVDSNFKFSSDAFAYGPDGSLDAKLKDQLMTGDKQVHDMQLKRNFEWALNEKDKAKIAEAMKQAEKEVARATKDAERAVREAGVQRVNESKRSAEDRASNANRNRSRQIDEQRHAIEQKREVLEKQMQQLEQHLGKLEAEMERLDEQEQQSEDLNEVDHEEEPAPTPEGAPAEGLPKTAN